MRYLFSAIILPMEDQKDVRYTLIEPPNKTHPPLLGGFSYCSTDKKLFIFGGYDYSLHSQTNRLYYFSLSDGTASCDAYFVKISV